MANFIDESEAPLSALIGRNHSISTSVAADITPHAAANIHSVNPINIVAILVDLGHRHVSMLHIFKVMLQLSPWIIQQFTTIYAMLHSNTTRSSRLTNLFMIRMDQGLLTERYDYIIYTTIRMVFHEDDVQQTSKMESYHSL